MGNDFEADIFGNGLQRKLGPLTATAIVVANMIGAGIFTTSGIMAAQLPGPAWVLFCWLFCGLIAISGALCYAELATRMPEAGGEYVYLRRLYHPALGFMTGWTSFFIGFSAPIALSALAFSEYLFAGLAHRFPASSPQQFWLIKKAVAVAVIATFTALHYVGLRLGARVQNLLTALKIAIILGLACAGLAFGSGDWANLSFDVSGSAGRGGGMALGAAMIMVMFSYSGWNASAYIAGELKRPRSTLPISLVAGTSIVIFLYLALNIFIFRSAPYAELQGVVAVVEVAAVSAFDNWVAYLLGGLIGLAMLSSLSAFVLIGPRVYYAMARDRLFFPFAGQVHRRYGVPSIAIAVQGLTAAVMVAVGSIEQLLIYVGFALGIFPWMAVAGLFIARRRRVGEESAASAWGYPFVPIFFLLSTLALMVLAFVERPLESSAAVVTVMLGLPCYRFLIRKAGRAE